MKSSFATTIVERAKAKNFFLVSTIILVTLLVTETLFYLINIVFGVDENLIGRTVSKESFLLVVLTVVILTPLIETFLFQKLPIDAALKKTDNHLLIIVVTGLIFSIFHVKSLINILFFFPSGVILSFCYIIFYYRKESAFTSTAVIHGIHNLIIVIYSYYFV